MREVRMTFGEHLEELRRRIIFCLIYLVLGVTICFVYGKQLMEFALGPHYQAIDAAERDRLGARLETTVTQAHALVKGRPWTEGRRQMPALDLAPEDWQALFAQDVIYARMQARLEKPAQDLEEAVKRAVPSLPESERAALGAAVGAFAREFSFELVHELSFGATATAESGVLRRLERVADRVRDAEKQAGARKAQRLIGWGKDLGMVVGEIESLRSFLALRRDQAKKTAPPSMEELKTRTAVSRLPVALDDLLSLLETDSKAMVQARSRSLMVTSYLESFASYLKVAFIFGVVITIPFILYELWKFIGAGLYPHEQRYVVLFLPLSIGLFVIGGLFGYAIMIPVGLEFLAGWGLEDVNLNFTLGNYIGLFFTLTLILGLVFQTPLVMIFLTKIGVVDVATLRKNRRAAIMISVCLAVILTPPDPFSWFLMWLPMMFLYEAGVVICAWLSVERKAA
jgi:Tat protein translocase TatC